MSPSALTKQLTNKAMAIVLIVCVGLREILSALVLMFQHLIPDSYEQFLILQGAFPILTVVLSVLFISVFKLDYNSVYRTEKGNHPFLWIGIFLGMVVIADVATSLLDDFIEMLGYPVPEAFETYVPQTVPQAICYFIVLAVLPPFAEETLYRGILCGTLAKANPNVAVWVSALVFGLMHQTISQIPFAFLLGLVLGAAYLKTKNIFIPILLHFLNNALATTLEILAIYLGDDAVSTIFGVVQIVFLALGVLAFVFGLIKREFSLKSLPHEEDAPSAWYGVATSPLFWISCAVFSVGTLAYMFEMLLL